MTPYPAAGGLEAGIIGSSQPPPDSFLAGAAHSVVTAGSKIALEATYLGIPNAVVGAWLPGCFGGRRRA